MAVPQLYAVQANQGRYEFVRLKVPGDLGQGVEVIRRDEGIVPAAGDVIHVEEGNDLVRVFVGDYPLWTVEMLHPGKVYPNPST